MTLPATVTPQTATMNDTINYLNCRTNHLNETVKHIGPFRFTRFPVDKTFINGKCCNSFSMTEPNVFCNTIDQCINVLLLKEWQKTVTDPLQKKKKLEDAKTNCSKHIHVGVQDWIFATCHQILCQPSSLESHSVVPAVKTLVNGHFTETK